ncbi:Putative Plasma membrane fusion protein prm1 [Aspergillus calidoustus]|uniref:Plasma membrane fusion protein PRM1 n=1 Tax=Aspergillus calidoustus TaxID=454130 RepID=A0A0U5GR53_ASPCI|nr:Putative Plasma membrane fusion protein prm1 [Aspergillus calidoustus]
MIFARSARSIFPLLPPYGAHHPNGGGRIIPLHPDGITPYMGLRSRLSQIWMNRWTILLLLVLVRLLIAVASLNTSMGSARREALSACTSVESMGSAMASTPHYAARGVNELTAASVETAVSALKTMLILTVTGVEEIIVFMIKMLYQTYLCLITMAIRGTVDTGVGLLKDAGDFLNSTIKSVGDDLSDAVDTFQDGFNDFLGLINGAATTLFGSEIPELNINSFIEELENAQLPSSIDEKLNKLNSSVPTFDEVSDFVENIIRTPFDEVKKLMNESMGTFTFDRDTLPVPARQQLSFCQGSDGIDSFFDKVSDIAETAKKIFIAILVIAAVLVCFPMAWQEIRRWRSQKERSQLVRKEAHDPMDVVYIVSRPYSSATGIKAASRFSNSRRQILVRWVVAYATSPPALFVLSLGVAGLFACLCQYLLLQAVEKAVPELSAEVGAFADKIVSSLDETSAEWSLGANKVIGDVNTDLNQNIFGWVNTTTTGVNDTLNAFVDETTGVLNDTFGGTVLYRPMMDVFNCLIGLKVAGIQRGLTWVHDHANIEFPALPNDTFSRGAAESLNDGNSSDSFLSSAGDSTSDAITEVVFRVTNAIGEGIAVEALISGVILLLWFVNLLFGVIRALSLFRGQERNRGDGGGAPAPGPLGPDQDGFHDVPLTAMPDTSSSCRAQPAPQYEPSTRTFATAGLPAAVTAETGYEDEKLGFAGQRNALQVEAPETRGSSYAEYGIEKGRI